MAPERHFHTCTEISVVNKKEMGRGEESKCLQETRELWLYFLFLQVEGSWINIFKYMSFTLVSGSPRSCFRSRPVTEWIHQQLTGHLVSQPSAKWWASSSSSFDMSLLLAALAPRLSILKRKVAYWLRIHLAMQGWGHMFDPWSGN